MSVTYLAPYPTSQFFNNNGTPNAGGFVYTYAAGTTTPIVTYVDNTGLTPNTNPIVLNARGECSIWIAQNTGYKFTLTDPSGNLIWTRDQVLESALLTLYGGVDVGVTNAYVLNYLANFTSLANGIVIYWTPSNTNTGGGVTINVNGLGVIPILNQNGQPLGPGQIVAGGVTAIFYYNGNWLLTSATASIQQTGSFAGTLTSGANIAAMPCQYAITGNICSVFLGYGTVLVSGGTLVMNGLPSVLQPLTQTQTFPVTIGANNGTAIQTIIGQVSPLVGFITFSASVANLGGGGWVASAEIGKHAGFVNYAQTVVWGLF